MEAVNIKPKLSILDLTHISFFVALIAICSWIYIPFAVPFTLQTFAVFAAMGILGGKRGTLAVIVYLILGAIGVPVFSGFGAGMGYMLGPTGGYLIGFVLIGLSYLLITKIFGKKTYVMVTAMVIGLILCYTFGTIWFIFLYERASGPVSLITVLGWCVIPFIIPDLIKIALALVVTKGVGRYIKN